MVAPDKTQNFVDWT